MGFAVYVDSLDQIGIIFYITSLELEVGGSDILSWILEERLSCVLWRLCSFGLPGYKFML